MILIPKTYCTVGGIIIVIIRKGKGNKCALYIWPFEQLKCVSIDVKLDVIEMRDILNESMFGEQHILLQRLKFMNYL